MPAWRKSVSEPWYTARMNYFAYGCNMDPSVMKGRLSKSSRRIPAWIKGYMIVFDVPWPNDPDIGFADIQPHPGGTVHGVLYTEVTKDGFAELDHQEGYPETYGRATMKVHTDEGAHEAVVYVGNPNIVRHSLKPSEHYLTCLLGGRDALPLSYENKLEHIPLHHSHR